MTNEQTHKHTNLRVVCHINFVQRDKEARGFAQGVGLDEKGKGLARDDAVSRVRPGRRGQPLPAPILIATKPDRMPTYSA